MKLLKQFQKLKEVKNMTDLKTTISGIVATVGFLLKFINVDLPPQVSDALIVLGVFFMGLFSKDKGGT